MIVRRVQMKRIKLFLCGALLLFSYHCFADQHIVWQKRPIEVSLPVNHERLVSFPFPVQMGVPVDLMDKVHVQNNRGTLYITAFKAFKTRRTEVKNIKTGEVILLNLSASEKSSDEPLNVVIGSEENKQNDTEQIQRQTIDRKTDPYIDLTRYAAQQLYAPKRLLSNPHHIILVNHFGNQTVPLFLDGSVVSQPLYEWQGKNYYVTAVLIRNQMNMSITLKPRLLCGYADGLWKTATFYPFRTLRVAGSPQDSTVGFLISSNPFLDSVKRCQG